MQSLADIKLSDTDPLHSTGTGSGEAAWHQPTTRYTPANQQHATASISTATASRRASNSGDTYEIRVHYPESRVDNHVLGREYLVYRITVTHIHTDGTTDQTVAYRRYSDFEWLHAQLGNAYIGYLIPPIPEKFSIADVASSVVSRSVSNVSTGFTSVLSQFTQQHNHTSSQVPAPQASTPHDSTNEHFVESRRKYLELFLVRCKQHPVLQNAPQLKFFLTASDQSMVETRTANTALPADNTASASATAHSNIAVTATNALSTTKASLFSMFNTGVSTLQSTFGAGGTNDAAEHTVLSSDDIKCNAIVQYAASLETKLSVMHNELNRMSKLLSDHADILSEHTLTCTAIEQLESSAPSQQTTLANMFHQLGTTATQLSEVEYRQVNDDNTTLKDTIKDYIRWCDAIKQMCQTRAVYRDELHQSSTQSVLDTVSSHKLSEITARVFSEFDQFKHNKQIDLLAVTAEYHKLHIDNLQRQQQLHQSALDELAKLSGGVYR